MASRGTKRSAQGDSNLTQQIDDFLKSADGLFGAATTESFSFTTLSKQDRPFRTVPLPVQKDNSSAKVSRVAVPVATRSDIDRLLAYQSNTPTISTSDDSDSDEIKQRGPYADAKMRIGREYQATPLNIVGPPGSRCQSPDRALCVWTPVPEAANIVTDLQVANFVDLAREKFGYSTEQALGMLYWHKHNIELATADLPNFIPYPDEWTHEEKVVFDQAFSFQGKQFHKIIHALPDKSVPHLVKYYYQWKKTRAKTSLMERRGQRGDDSGSEWSDTELPELRPGCRRVRRPQHQQQQQQQKTAEEKEQESSGLDSDSRQKQQQQQQHRRKLPRGIFLDYEALLAMSGQGRGRVSAVVDALDAQLASARSRVQRNRAQLTQRWESLLSQIQAYQEPDAEGQISYKWTDEELLLAVQGVRRYGKDFRSIAQLIGSKTENHVRYFFAQYRSKFGLDSVLAEYNKDAGKK